MGSWTRIDLASIQIDEKSRTNLREHPFSGDAHAAPIEDEDDDEDENDPRCHDPSWLLFVLPPCILADGIST